LREETARLVERDAEGEAELDRARADLAVLQRMVFGRSSERSRPEPPGRDDAGGRGRERRSGTGGKRGSGARAGRRDYSHLPRFEPTPPIGMRAHTIFRLLTKNPVGRLL
jgi:transposase